MARKLRSPSAGKSGKSKTQPAAPASPSNVSDATLQEFYNKALAAKVEHEAALKEASAKNGAFRAVLKDAKKVGILPSDILWRLSQRFRSPQEIDAETKRLNRLAKLTNLPIGTQLGLLDDGMTVATSIDNERQAEQTLNAVEDAKFSGQEAGKLGKPHSECPHPEGTPEHEAWLDGWSIEQKNLALGFGKETGAGVAAH